MLLLLGQRLLTQSGEILDFIFELLICFLQFFQFLGFYVHGDVFLDLVSVEFSLQDVKSLASSVCGLIEEGLIVDVEFVLLRLQQALVFSKCLPYQIFVIFGLLHFLSLLCDTLVFPIYFFPLTVVQLAKGLHLFLFVPH